MTDSWFDEYNYEVPNFLIKQEMPNEITKLLIKKSLLFTRSVLLNKFFIPNNLMFQKSRIILENYFRARSIALTIKELNKLSDRDLADLGIHRSEITSKARLANKKI